MARPRKYANRRACERKWWYDSEVSARMGAQATLSNSAHARLYVYECPCCGRWHVTSSPDGKSSAVTRRRLWEHTNDR